MRFSKFWIVMRVWERKCCSLKPNCFNINSIFENCKMSFTDTLIWMIADCKPYLLQWLEQWQLHNKCRIILLQAYDELF
jgi:hypothetical protein